MHVTFEPRHDKTNKMSVRPAKTQIRLGIRPVRSESSLCAQWVAKDPSFLLADSESADQTGRMPRLISVFAGRTLILLVLSCRGSFEPPWIKDAYHIGELRWLRRACASAYSHQSLHCSLAQYWELEDASDKEPHLRSNLVAAHVRLKVLKPHDSKVLFLTRRHIYLFNEYL